MHRNLYMLCWSYHLHHANVVTPTPWYVNCVHNISCTNRCINYTSSLSVWTHWVVFRLWFKLYSAINILLVFLWVPTYYRKHLFIYCIIYLITYLFIHLSITLMRKRVQNLSQEFNNVQKTWSGTPTQTGFKVHMTWNCWWDSSAICICLITMLKYLHIFVFFKQMHFVPFWLLQCHNKLQALERVSLVSVFAKRWVLYGESCHLAAASSCSLCVSDM